MNCRDKFVPQETVLASSVVGVGQFGEIVEVIMLLQQADYVSTEPGKGSSNL